MHVTASAPGKLVLFGDHAVVHGQPGIVTAVDLRYRVQAECLAEPLLRIETPTLPEREVPFPARGMKYHAETAYVEAALRQLLIHSPIDCGFTSGRRARSPVTASAAPRPSRSLPWRRPRTVQDRTFPAATCMKWRALQYWTCRAQVPDWMLLLQCMVAPAIWSASEPRRAAGRGRDVGRDWLQWQQGQHNCALAKGRNTASQTAGPD